MTDMTLIGLVVGLSVAAGMEARRIGVLSAALVVPLSIVALVVWNLLRKRRESENSAAIFAEAVAGEMRAGAVVRDAMVSAAEGIGLSVSGEDVDSVVGDVASQLPGIGPELRSAARAAANSGSRVADLFDEIGGIAIAQAEVSREVRVATAPARATAMVFGGAPTLYLALQIRSGGFSSLVATPGQRVSGMIGLGLFLAGLAIVSLILWRAS